MMLFIMINKSDEFQLVNFITMFKNIQATRRYTSRCIVATQPAHTAC